MSRLQWGNKRGKQVGTVKQVDVYEKASALLSDVILNYKTVISFGDKNVK
jgi:sporulation protein YlmC with PRC-barrel domain